MTLAWEATVLNVSPALALATYFADQGAVVLVPPIGTLPAGTLWPCDVAHQPAAGDNVVTVYDTTGIKDGREMLTGATLVHPGIQVRVRGSNYPTARAKIAELTRLMDAAHNVQVVVDAATLTIHAITRRGDALPLGFEEGSKRVLYTINVTVTITAVEGS